MYIGNTGMGGETVGEWAFSSDEIYIEDSDVGGESDGEWTSI